MDRIKLLSGYNILVCVKSYWSKANFIRYRPDYLISPETIYLEK
jgi:hypothetical protein